MRLTHVCEEMNITGCTEWHNQVNNLTGFKWFIHYYQLEIAIITVFLIMIILFAYYIIKRDALQKQNE